MLDGIICSGVSEWVISCVHVDLLWRILALYHLLFFGAAFGGSGLGLWAKIMILGSARMANVFCRPVFEEVLLLLERKLAVVIKYIYCGMVQSEHM